MNVPAQPTIKEAVLDAFYNRNKIQIIQFYRYHKGTGLVEAKGAIDTVLPNSNNGTYTWGETHRTQLLNLFFGSDKKDSEDFESLENAILCILKNWKKLGYPSAKVGIEAVLKNF